VDPRNRTQVLLRVQSIEEVSARWAASTLLRSDRGLGPIPA